MRPDPSPGHRTPDAPLRDAVTGAPIRLFDLFRGPHFTLLSLGEHPVPALGEAGTGIVKACRIGPGGYLDDGGRES